MASRQVEVQRPDWSRKLPRPLTIPGVMRLEALLDVRELLRQFSDEHNSRSRWRYVERQITDAAASGDVSSASAALRMVMILEGMEWQEELDLKE
jgi:hypothetical protein